MVCTVIVVACMSHAIHAPASNTLALISGFNTWNNPSFLQLLLAADPNQQVPSQRDSNETNIRRILDLSKKIVPLLDNGDIAAAVSAQKELVSLQQQTSSVKPAQTQRDIAFLAEIQRIAQLPPEKIKTYLDGRKQVASAALKIAVEDYGAAEQLLAGALDNYQKSIGENSFAVAGTLDAIGSILTAREDSVNAIENFSKALAIRKSLLGPRHGTFFKEHAYISGAHVVAKEFKEAEANIREALLLYRTYFGANSVTDIDYAVLLGNLSYTLAEQKKLLEAEAVCLQAISIAEELQKHDSLEMFTFQYVLGIVAVGFEEYEKAEYYLRRALILRDKWLPLQHSLHARVLDRYAIVLHKLNRNDEAGDIEKKAAKIHVEAKASRKARPK